MVSSHGKSWRMLNDACSVLAGLWVLGFALTTCLGSEPISIWLRDGRQIRGLIDSQTDQHQLWLRREEQAIDVTSGFAWNEVLQVQQLEQTYSADAFRAVANEFKSPGRKFLDLPPNDTPRTNTEIICEAVVPSPPVGPIRTLVIEAQLAQWDDDAQTDGLRVVVMPLNAQGELVAVDGQIDFTLVGQVEWTEGGHHGPLVPKFRELERVSRIVRREHFAPGPAVYDLPFSKVHPDFDLSLATKALVHARLGVPGRGVFEASDADVMLREYSRFRDQLQYFTPRRYLPRESGGQGHR